MNENEFEVDGAKYVATEYGKCKDCAFNVKNTKKSSCAEFTPECLPNLRKDGRNVIFVEVKDE